MEILNKKLRQYCKQHTTPESEVAKFVQQNTDEQLKYSGMLSGHVVGQLLAMLIRISGAQRVLEIGTFTGYSAICMAEALPDDGALITCDYNERYEKMARTAFEKSEHGHKITLKMGMGLNTIETLSDKFDFIFLDADKRNYPNYYPKLFTLLNQGGILAVDNVLWSGKILDPPDEQSEAIYQLNEMIAEDERVEQVMIPVRDGLNIVRKK